MRVVVRVALAAAVLACACVPAALTVAEGPDATLPGDGGANGDDGNIGCIQATDCPTGQACDPTSGVCSTSCDGGVPCNGGCCGTGTCQPGDASDNCGNLGSACSTCTLPTPTCSEGACIASCSADAACGPGQCCIAGGCAAGASSPTTCGTAGACQDCTSKTAGHLCIDGGCGCRAAADCAPNWACNTRTAQCTQVCLDAGATGCNGGCCGDPTFEAGAFVCNPGGLAGSCGNDGGFCFQCPKDCGALHNGSRCRGATCGCYDSDQDAADRDCMRVLTSTCTMGKTPYCTNYKGGTCELR